MVQEVDKTMAASFAQEIGALYVETSAKDDMNIHDLFTGLGNQRYSVVSTSKCLVFVVMCLCAFAAERLPAPPQPETNIIRPTNTLQPAPAQRSGICC
jgi:hypothetical protein